MFKKKNEKPTDEEKKEMTEHLQSTKTKIFSNEFSFFIDSIGTEGQLHGGKEFDEEYKKMCKKIQYALEGEKTAESILALSFHLTAIMSLDEHQKLIDKVKSIKEKRPNYIH